MKIYPAIDLKAARAVRLVQGRADKEIVYYEDPGEPARLWKEAGAEWIHVVDLDGAFEGTTRNWPSIKKIVSEGIKVELGGGIRTESAVAEAFDAGVSRIIIGTKAADGIQFIKALVQKYGDKIAVGIDAKDGNVSIKGWVDTTSKPALELAQEVSNIGVQTIIYTDISRDGMLTGPNFEAQATMLEAVEANIIASGGVSKNEDIERFAEMAKKYSNLDGVIVGKALYDKRVNLPHLLKIAKGT